MNKYQEELKYITADVNGLKSNHWLSTLLTSHLVEMFSELNTATARHEVKNFFDSLED